MRLERSYSVMPQFIRSSSGYWEGDDFIHLLNLHLKIRTNTTLPKGGAHVHRARASGSCSVTDLAKKSLETE